MSRGRHEARVAETVRLVAVAARVLLMDGVAFSPQFIADVCRQARINPEAFRTLFPTDDSLLDAINALLVEDCTVRLEAAVAGFEPIGSGDEALVEASVALASAWPIDRGTILIRAHRKARALRGHGDGELADAAERQYLGAVCGAFTELMAKLRRRFVWSQFAGCADHPRHLRALARVVDVARP